MNLDIELFANVKYFWTFFFKENFHKLYEFLNEKKKKKKR